MVHRKMNYRLQHIKLAIPEWSQRESLPRLCESDGEATRCSVCDEYAVTALPKQIWMSARI